METYAGYSENADWNVGRVLDAIEEMGELENTRRDLDLGRQRRQHGGHALGNVQRDDDAERDPVDARAADGPPLQARRPRGLGRRPHGPALRGRLGVGEQLPLRLGQAGRLPPRRDAEPARRPLSERDLRSGLGARALHACDRHRPDRARARGHPRPDARRRDRAGAAARVHVRRLALRRRRARAAHAAVLRGRREPGDVQGRLVARDAPAAHPLAARPRGAAALRPRLEPGRRPGRALLPARRLRPGEEPRRPASGEGRGAAEALLGGGGALPGAADPRRARRPSTGSCPRSRRCRRSRTADGSRTSPPG